MGVSLDWWWKTHVAALQTPHIQSSFPISWACLHSPLLCPAADRSSQQLLKLGPSHIFQDLGCWAQMGSLVDGLWFLPQGLTISKTYIYI